MNIEKIEDYIIENKDKLPLSYNDLIIVRKNKPGKKHAEERRTEMLFENLEFYKKISRF
ncbi:hypothetical protein [Flavobacterium sp. Leaf359]|uniref:hypothetical protein n=1 Tax=Flavobacterium sp. Leaf359 TaxID=1736351 RepID=UPI000A59DD3F|nr:hypothetical protein [Flavobacterium sp. Leaf359]